MATKVNKTLQGFSGATPQNPTGAAQTFQQPGPFSAGPTPVVPQHYGTTTFAQVSGSYDQLRDPVASANPTIPRSFVDAKIDDLNQGKHDDVVKVSGGSGMSQAQISQIVAQEWAAAPQADKTAWQKKDTDAAATQKQTDLTDSTTKQIQGGINAPTQVANKAWSSLAQPAIDKSVAAQGSQLTTDRAAEQESLGYAKDFKGTLDQTQALRNAGISGLDARQNAAADEYNGKVDQYSASNDKEISTFHPVADQYNAADAGLVSNLWGATNSTNSANSALGQQEMQQLGQSNALQSQAYGTLAGQNSAVNANQTGLYNTLSGQASAVNANQTGLFNTLSGQANQTNAAQSAANSTFQGQLGDTNALQSSQYQQFVQQLSGLSGEDRTNYINYIGETNPLMAQQLAQGSDPADVAAEKDVQQRFKDISTPEVTAQERLIASQARQQFEAGDQSNRDAVMQQLRGRGLQSGGLVIAGQQSAQQQLAQDRMNAEMGLQASAVGRAVTGLQGYGQASTVLRNADDAMKNFQDVYAQNDAVRRGNLAQQRSDQGFKETSNILAQDQAGFDAGRATNQDNTQRNALGFDANTTTNNNNYARDQSVFDAGTTTNNNNYARDQSVFDAGTTTNQDNSVRNQSTYNAASDTAKSNFDRTDSAVKNNYTINQGNLGNTQFATTTNIGTNKTAADRDRQAALDTISGNQTQIGNAGTKYSTTKGAVADQFARDSYGWDTADTDAGQVLGAFAPLPGQKSANAASEAQTASSNRTSGVSDATTETDTASKLAKDKQDALAKVLGGWATSAALGQV